MTQPFRTKYIAVSSGVYDALRALADIEGASCPDEVADLRLGLLLSQECDIQWAISERQKRMKAFREDYLDRIRTKQKPEEDQLP